MCFAHEISIYKTYHIINHYYIIINVNTRNINNSRVLLMNSIFSPTPVGGGGGGGTWIMIGQDLVSTAQPLKPIPI